MALMRTIPGALVLDAADDVQLEWIVREVAKSEGVHYFRAGRKGCRRLYEQGSTFELGKGNILKEGKDVLIIASGQVVNDALDAAEMLEADGISVEVIDMFTIKPFDKELAIKEAAGKKAVFTFENHSIIGGLGSCVAETYAEEGVCVKFKRVGVEDRFGQVGSADFLQKEFGLTAEALYNKVKETI